MNLSRLKRLLVGRGSPAQAAFLALARLGQARFESTLSVDGHRITAGTSDRALALLLHRLGLVDTAEKRYLAETVRPGMTCLDIGANIGIYTLYLARLAGPSGRVIAFEPEPENFALLRKNIIANRYGNVECVPKAVSDRAGSASLGFCEENRGDHRLGAAGRRAVPVETVRVDDYFPPASRVDVIKMDIQGSELAAMEGMRRALADNPGVRIVAEFCPALLETSGSAAEAFARFWHDQGFSAFLIGEGRRPVSLADAAAFTDLGRRQGYLNVLLSRSAV
ncbi:MAG: FkbM family methyltransferase [Elusimicrobia bacterium]|nr:FkbM family methyltransferase [Elusimicrobiota bacterium]